MFSPAMGAPVPPISDYRTPHVAAICDVSTATVAEWIRLGLLPARKLHGRHVVSGADLATFLANQKKAVQP